MRGGKDGYSGSHKSKLRLREEKRRERIARGRRLEKAEGRNQKRASKQGQASTKSKWSAERARKQVTMLSEICTIGSTKSRTKATTIGSMMLAGPALSQQLIWFIQAQRAPGSSTTRTTPDKPSRAEKEADNDVVILDEDGQEVSAHLPRLQYLSDIIPNAESNNDDFNSKLKPKMDAEGNIYWEKGSKTKQPKAKVIEDLKADIRVLQSKIKKKRSKKQSNGVEMTGHDQEGNKKGYAAGKYGFKEDISSKKYTLAGHICLKI
eukprot:761797-Hanusia_phi.AAC.4